MPNYCKIILIGHLGSDPELKSVGDNTVCNFSMAVNNPFKKDDPPVWYRIAAWNKTGEACERYLSKGNPVYVEGELNPREYESQGEKRTSLDVRANVVQFLGSKGGGESGGSSTKPPSHDHTSGDDGENDLPF
jgi:single-strand DNA-binding protein